VHPPNPQLGLLERRVRPLGALPAMGDGVRPANTRPIGRTESATVLFDVGGEWHSQRWQLLRPHGLQPLRPHSAPFAPMHPPEQSSSTQSGAFPGDFSMTRWDVLGRLDAAGRRPAVVGRRRPIQRKRWRSGPSHTTQPSTAGRSSRLSFQRTIRQGHTSCILGREGCAVRQNVGSLRARPPASGRGRRVRNNVPCLPDLPRSG
jgi:hypothetical protein